MKPLLSLDFNDASWQETPYENYQMYQAAQPVFFNPSDKCYYLFNYDDVVTLLKHPNARQQHSQWTQPARYTDDNNVVISFFKKWVVFQDPPVHQALRQKLSAYFSQNPISALKHDVGMIVDNQISTLSGDQSVDLVADYAYPITLRVIGRFLGYSFQQSELDSLAPWLSFISHAIDDHVEDTKWPELESAVRNLYAFCESLPPPDAHGVIHALRQTGSMLTEDISTIDFISFMLWSGHATTKEWISNSILLLEGLPEFKQLMSQTQCQTTQDQIMAECLRLEPPLHKIRRYSHGAIELSDTTIEPEQTVIAVLAAANRDPKQFEEPHKFRLNRNVANLSFGYGQHFCLGHHLAKLEANIAVSRLFSAYPNLNILTNNVKWAPITTIRGLEKLPAQLVF